MDPHLINLETAIYFEDDAVSCLDDITIDHFNLNDPASNATQFNLLEILRRPVNLN
ncbi:MAG TPA: hypothetical protein VKA49_03940 [Flavitalea sp.]|nr:hypothetical protein [Flavitalea sp.]